MDYTSIKVGQLPTGEISGGNFIPHEVAGVLKKATFTDLAAFIGASDAVGFRAVSVQNGSTLPTTDTQEFILVGPGTYNNVGGGLTITVTEELNALVSNGTYWFVGVQIPIDAPPGNAIWGQIIGTLSNQTDLKNILDLKADLVDGKVPASQLPSYVDDIIEVANFSALPTTGETGKIYLTLDNNKIYRWSGSIYIEIAAENAVWGQIVGTLSNQTDLQNALNLRVPYTGATGNVDLGTNTLSSKNLVVNHASGSGVAAQITKGGNGEAFTVVKTSGTGNAASITGGVTLLSELHLNTDLADAYIASAAIWNAKQNALNGTGLVKSTSGTISYITDNSTNWNDAYGDTIISSEVTGTTTKTLFLNRQDGGSVVCSWTDNDTSVTIGTANGLSLSGQALSLGLSGTSSTGALSSTDWSTFNNKQNALNGTGFVKISGTTISYDNNTYALDSEVVKLTGNQSISGQKTFNSGIVSNVTSAVGGLDVFNSGGRGVSIQNSSGAVIGLSINNDNSTTINPLIVQKQGVSVFRISDSGGGYFAGNVGIGTTSPSAKLSLAGASELLWFQNDSAYMSFYNTGNSIRTGYIQANSGSNITIMPEGSNALILGAGANERMRITSGGNVGIGTTSPSAKLHVFDSNNGFNLFLEKTSGFGALFLLKNTSTSSNDLFRVLDSSNNVISQIQPATNGINFATGNVGIGTTSPSGLLHLASGSDMYFKMSRANGSFASQFYRNAAGGSLTWQSILSDNTTTHDFIICGEGDSSHAATKIVMQPQGGNVAIGTTSPSYTLHVNGSVAGTSAYNNLSDKRYKKDILPIENALDKILALNGVTFNWNKEATDMNLDDNNHIGLLAQDVEEILPQAVTTGIDENETKSVAYTDIVPVLIEAIKELKAEIEILKNK